MMSPLFQSMAHSKVKKMLIEAKQQKDPVAWMLERVPRSSAASKPQPSQTPRSHPSPSPQNPPSQPLKRVKLADQSDPTPEHSHHMPEIITIIMQGKTIYLSARILEKVPGFAWISEVRRTGLIKGCGRNGPFYVKGDAQMFPYILHYLYTGAMPIFWLPPSSTVPDEAKYWVLKEQAESFGLTELVEHAQTMVGLGALDARGPALTFSTR